VSLTLRALNRATLARQRLLERTDDGVETTTRHVLALQAQEPASPYLALWNRIEGFAASDLDRAFRTFALVKATLMRITLHAVGADDHPVLATAMRPTLRAAGLADTRFRVSGLDDEAFAALADEVVAVARQRTVRRADVEAIVAERLGAPPAPGVWRALRMVAPLVHAPSDEPWSFGRTPAFVAAPRVADAEASTHEATIDLVQRYLRAFGPATRSDLAQFALLRQRDLASVWAELDGSLLQRKGAGGELLLDVADAPLPDADLHAPARLLAMWDSVLLAYADRARVIPPAYRPLVIRRNGDVLPTVLVDGFVAGVWRQVDAGIEITAFEPLPTRAWDELDGEARRLLVFLAGRDDAVYRRFEHWWRFLAGAQVRVVGAGSA